MPTYEISIEETLSKSVTVEADSLDDAYDVVKMMYRNGDIILDSEDYCCTEYFLVTEGRWEKL